MMKEQESEAQREKEEYNVNRISRSPLIQLPPLSFYLSIY